MRSDKNIWVVALAVCLAVTACGGKETNQAALQSEQEHVQQGIAVAEGDDPNRWAPPQDAIDKAKADAQQPEIRVGNLAELKNDPGIGEMEVLPPPAPPPKLVQGDEADQYGLPAWEQMARGELHVKRIQY